jgi:hypothetical protein
MEEKSIEKPNVEKIAEQMYSEELPERFVKRVAELGQNNLGMAELMVLWSESDDSTYQDALIADMQDLIGEAETIQQGREEPHVRFDDLDWIADNIMTFKDSLRLELDKRNISLTELSERTGIPVPSLSRFFDTASMPRRKTLLKIADAANLSQVEIATEWDY